MRWVWCYGGFWCVWQGGRYLVWEYKNLKPTRFFFNISSFEFHAHQQQRVIKNDCRAAARPRLIIQQFRPIFVISCLYAFVQQHSSFDPLTSGETYSWPLSVTSWCVFRLSWVKDGDKRTKISGRTSPGTESDWQATKDSLLKRGQFFREVSTSAVSEWQERTSFSI